MSDSVENPWRAVLHQRMRGQPHPMLIMPDTLWSAASLWAGTRAWLTAFRAAGLVAGDRLVCALPEGPAFIQVLLACLWDEIVFAPISVRGPVAETVRTLDARAAVVADGLELALDCGVFVPDAAAQPPDVLPSLRAVTAPPVRGVALLLATSGSSGAPKWIGLSNRNLFAVLQSHREPLALAGARVLSVLPWHHAFGLILGLLQALLEADEIVRDVAGGRDLDALAATAREHQITHLDLVPLLAERMLVHPDLHGVLQELRGGVVGGAPIHARLAEALRVTRLRVGYGLTEAAPGVTLGAPGDFSAGWIGAPIGCEVRRDDDGVLAFRGDNACHGHWIDGAYHQLPTDRWHRTEDHVEWVGPGLRYLGRAGANFKLANGRMVCSARLETDIRDALPDVTDVVVHSPDGRALEVVVSTDCDAYAATQALRRALGALGAYALVIRQIPASAWPRTAKGDIDRRQCARSCSCSMT